MLILSIKLVLIHGISSRFLRKFCLTPFNVNSIEKQFNGGWLVCFVNRMKVESLKRLKWKMLL